MNKPNPNCQHCDGRGTISRPYIAGVCDAILPCRCTRTPWIEWFDSLTPEQQRGVALNAIETLIELEEVRYCAGDVCWDGSGDSLCNDSQQNTGRETIEP